ncbi:MULTISPECIES: acyltransferase [Legionella]|uniref:Acyltransferase n=1 Tax=Legionella septentrionalis TaxID=2498109 RepID=A0A433JKN5_9GAMM|nr:MULTISPECIES: acyltransferase [Legionella]MCP0914468.1 acyltransferase [Legionella sp. 27cVA30]RUQ89469.1 acyltransferase [Legionella septentrionalis]RUQ97310.1 acyltransferase [Legionella septentrionalis]RUR10482.1 acyltransferase [Legionella septentrionalis]RUR16102.1 acyltransferase [Legionella septentrionalis]
MMPITRFLVCLMFIFMTGCNASRHVQVPVACKNACLERLSICQQVCDNSCRQCAARANRAAERSYNQYKKEECLRGGIITRELKSYRDPLQCRKTTCECGADYRVCLKACSGVIHKRLQVAPACC